MFLRQFFQTFLLILTACIGIATSAYAATPVVPSAPAAQTISQSALVSVAPLAQTTNMGCTLQRSSKRKVGFWKVLLLTVVFSLPGLWILHSKGKWS